MKTLRKPRRSPAASPRRGVAAIIIIAVLAMTMAFAGVWARRIVLERRAARRAEEQQQARWLAEAGVRRAAALLSADPAYTGETWTIDAAEIDRPSPAEIEIVVEPSDSATAPATLVAKARYPRDVPRVQSTKTIKFTPPPREPQS
jgi:Tfp pilus assembly protein PilX